MQVKEGIHRLTQGVVNFYLIEEVRKLLLVDADAPGDWDLLVRAVADLGRRLDDLEAVLLTHAYPDHIGTAERARATAHARVSVALIHQHEVNKALRVGHPPDASIALPAVVGWRACGVIQAPLVERERELKEFERLLGLPPALGKTHWPPLTNRVAT